MEVSQMTVKDYSAVASDGRKAKQLVEQKVDVWQED